jgi:hypothetical protein
VVLPIPHRHRTEISAKSNLWPTLSRVVEHFLE